MSRRLALAGTIPVVVANAWYIAWILLAIGRERPFAGDFGLVGFWAGLALWLADAWFGIIALRLGVLWRWAAVALVVGSLLAILGMDRLGLTSAANPTVFRPIALAGIALNGIAWVLLGLETRGAAAARPADCHRGRHARGVRRPGARSVIAAAAISYLWGCAAAPGSEPLVEPEQATPPPDWVLVTNGAGDLRVALPQVARALRQDDQRHLRERGGSGRWPGAPAHGGGPHEPGPAAKQGRDGALAPAPRWVAWRGSR